MSLALSAVARATLVDHLEGVLCNPDALQKHLATLRAVPVDSSASKWDEDLLAQVLEDTRRLELLRDEELQRLNRDPAALIALGDEITRDWWPVWNEPLAAVGRAWREQAGVRLPEWDDIVRGRAEEEAAAGSSNSHREFAIVPFGKIREQPFEAKGRALLLEWNWTRTREHIEGLREDSNACRNRHDGRREVRFRLRAYSRRGNKPGSWVLTIAGDPPEIPLAALEFSLNGWGRSLSDSASSAPLRPGPTEFDLTEFSDPTGLFDDSKVAGTAMVAVACRGAKSWRVVEHVPGPDLDRNFYEAWLSDKIDPDAKDSCLARLRAIVERRGRPRDDHRIEEALIDASLDVMRRRYVYREIRSYSEFGRLVFVSARNRYYRLVRGDSEPDQINMSFDPADRKKARSGLERDELGQAEDECMSRLEPRIRDVIMCRIDEDMPFSEIGERLRITEQNARVIFHRGMRSLAVCMSAKGYGPADLGLLR